MDDDPAHPYEDAALQAFRQMQEEARERHSELIARLAEAPDYASSFALIQKTLDWIVEQYATGLSVEDILKKVTLTASKMDRPDRDALKQATLDMLESARAMEESRQAHVRGLQRAPQIHEQTRQCKRWLIAGLAGGAMAMTILPGMVARIAPTSWLLPERLAARTLRLSIADAGRHMLVAAYPNAAAEILGGAEFMLDNRDAIAKCRGPARKNGGKVACKLKV